jgi:predicted nucleotidyltransferase
MHEKMSHIAYQLHWKVGSPFPAKDLGWRRAHPVPILGIIVPNMGTRKESARVHPSRKRSRKVTLRQSTPEDSLADALFTSTQQRIFALLFGQPDRSFFLAELIKLAQSGRGAVQRELARLVDVGLIGTQAVGNQKHFQANRAAPIFDELRAIVLKTVGLAEPIKKALACSPEPIDLALIYGSVAKQSDTASSDVDLLIVSEKSTLEQLYNLLIPAEKAISRKINPTLLTPLEFNQRRNDNSPFLTKVLSGQHILLAGDLDGVNSAR